MLAGEGLDVLIGGWIARMAAGALYTVLAGVYLAYFERPIRRWTNAPRIWDVFDALTAHGRRAVEHAAAGRPLAFLLVGRRPQSRGL